MKCPKCKAPMKDGKCTKCKYKPTEKEKGSKGGFPFPKKGDKKK